jgi:Fe-Mn family superoxide dismutase
LRYDNATDVIMKYVLPTLPYAFDAFVPHLSVESFEYHYIKHHQTYVDNLNVMVEQNPEYANLSLLELLKKIWDELLERLPELKNSDGCPVPNVVWANLFNNAGQHYNHSFFWNSITPIVTKPSQRLNALLDKTFGGIDGFFEQFCTLGVSTFGSGWVWLIYNVETDGLFIAPTMNAQYVLPDEKQIPLLVCDVWEHAYYIDYRNRRKEFLIALKPFFNWDYASACLEAGTELTNPSVFSKFS